MMTKLRVASLIPWLQALGAIAYPEHPAERVPDFTSLVVFGDSYTDQRVHSYTPSADGTTRTPSTNASTGGRVWPQYVGQYTGANIYDYAVSGAICTSIFSPTTRNGMNENQVPQFLLDNSWTNSTTGKPALMNPGKETVYAVWIGTNDLGNQAFFTDVQPHGLALTAFTDCVFTQLDRLYSVGARRFVLLNIGPLELSPQYAPPEAGGQNSTQFFTDKYKYNPNITQSTEKMRQYSKLVNEVVGYQTPYQLLIAKRYPKSSFAVFDINSLMTDIYNDPLAYLNGTVTPNVTSSVKQCGSPCLPLDVRDSYMWYDTLHPSEQVDRIIAQEFVEVVKARSKWAKYWNDF